MSTKRALVCGVTGQDGAYLTRLLLDKGYAVVGTSRDAASCNTARLDAVGVSDDLELVSMQLGDFRSVLQVLTRFRPDEVYNLAGQSSVGLSFEQPVETLESIATGTLNLLESIRFLGRDIRVYNASSGDCFGEMGTNAANEETPFRPRSPYGVAKCTAHLLMVNYREAYGLFACNGVLFNHESPLRPERFVTRKITRGVASIKAGLATGLSLGNLQVCRDWGWAPEYVDAMWRILNHEVAEDFVVASGSSVSLEGFVDAAFEHVGLDWREWVSLDESLARPSEILANRGDPSKASKLLGWKATIGGADVARRMVDAELAELS